MGYFSQEKAAQSKNGFNGAGAPGPEAAAPAGKSAATTVSTLGPGMLITGNIVCEGAAQIFGRVIGDVQAVEIIIGEGALVEGNITAHEIAIEGAFKGTVRGHSVRLRGNASVDGEIYSKSLTVEENVLFEGLSRRLDKSIELPSCAQAAGGDTAAPAATAGTPHVSELII
ncbi:MAG TPA: polymer-forming cytoskeletal protein [Xanthobacteraceae bacterium]|nr:polymer-forming cytoskeletal protein [Xanthobacteraceae bacterium]